jgi:hypothetical protein
MLVLQPYYDSITAHAGHSDQVCILAYVVMLCTHTGGNEVEMYNADEKSNCHCGSSWQCRQVQP